MTEGIAGYASSAKQVALIADSSVAVAKKVQDQAKLEGQAAVELIEAVAVGSAQARPTGDHTGRHVNVHA